MRFFTPETFFSRITGDPGMTEETRAALQDMLKVGRHGIDVDPGPVPGSWAVGARVPRGRGPRMATAGMITRWPCGAWSLRAMNPHMVGINCWWRLLPDGGPVEEAATALVWAWVRAARGMWVELREDGWEVAPAE
jgi:hypothetical protein